MRACFATICFATGASALDVRQTTSFQHLETALKAVKANDAPSPDVSHTKCKKTDATRLFRKVDLNYEQCEKECRQTEGCLHFSVGKNRKNKQVCHGCTTLENANAASDLDIHGYHLQDEDAPSCWSSGERNSWVGHSNDDEYAANSNDGRDHWAMDNHDSGGWRWCGISQEDCQSSCEALGDCKAIYYTPNRCCFPSKTAFAGSHTPGGSGGFAVSLETEEHWTKGEENSWVGHSNDDEYAANSNDGRDHWAMDNHDSGGWRWCGISQEDCQTSCDALGDCKAIYYTPNRCCFPSKSDFWGSHTPGGSGGFKVAHSVCYAAEVVEDEPAPMTEAMCPERCAEMDFCCNDPNTGSNQYISCSQACVIRVQGTSESECKSLCHQDRTCSTTVNGHSFGHCGRCADLEDHCPHGVQSTSECEAGCSF